MITRLMQGVARSLFIIGCCFAAVAALALYGCYRCLRAAFARTPGMPVRDATFNLLMGIAALAGVLREQAIKRERALQRAAAEQEPEPEPSVHFEAVAESDFEALAERPAE